MSTKARCFVRVRGLTPLEKKRQMSLSVACKAKEVRVTAPLRNEECRTRCDGVFDDTYQLMEREFETRAEQQQDVFERLGGEILRATRGGYDALVVSLGAAGSGKTYSMIGARGSSDAFPSDGLLQYLLCEMLGEAGATPHLLLTCYELHGDCARDRLAVVGRDAWAPDAPIREGYVRGHFVDGLTRVAIVDAQQGRHVIEEACRRRAIETLITGEDGHVTTCVWRIAVERLSDESDHGELTQITIVDGAASLMLPAEASGKGKKAARAKARGSLRPARALSDALGSLSSSAVLSDSQVRAVFAASTLTQLLRRDLERSMVFSLMHVAPSEESFDASQASFALLKMLRGASSRPGGNWRAGYDESAAKALSDRIDAEGAVLISNVSHEAPIADDAKRALVSRVRHQMKVELEQRECELHSVRAENAISWDDRIDLTKASVRAAHDARAAAEETRGVHLCLLHPDAMMDRIVRLDVFDKRGLSIVGRAGAGAIETIDVDAHDYVSLPGIGVPETPCNFASFEQQQLFVKMNEREYLEQNATTAEVLLNGAVLDTTGAQTLQHHDTLTVGCFVVFEVKGDGKSVAFGRAVQRPWREHIRRAMRQGSPPIKGARTCIGHLFCRVHCLLYLPLTHTAPLLFTPIYLLPRDRYSRALFHYSTAALVRRSEEILAELSETAPDGSSASRTVSSALQNEYDDVVRRIDLYSLAREATLIAHALGRNVRVDVDSALDSSELVLCAREGTALELDHDVEGAVWSGENLVAFTDARIHTMRTQYRNRLIAGGLDDIGYVHGIPRRAACLSARLYPPLCSSLTYIISLTLVSLSSRSFTHSLP